MISTIIWNIRGVKSRGAFERLKFLSKIHNTQIIAIQEPLVDACHIDKYRKGLSFEGCSSNCNGKFWILWSNDFHIDVAEDNEQQLTLKVTNTSNTEIVWFTVVYAKSKQHLRLPLSDSLRNCNNFIDERWCICGDFNAIMSPDEKKGVWWMLVTKASNSHGVMLGKESKKYGKGWTERSDHTPTIVKYSTSGHSKIRYFKFLNFWIDQPNFKDVVQKAWNEGVGGNSMRRLHLKMKNVSHKRSLWSREHIGNVFHKVKEREAKMLDLETDCIKNDNDDLRPQIHKTQAEHTRWLKCEQSILRQRANIRWLEDGDSNTKYFHVIISEKIKRATIHKIQLENGQWITGDDQIAKEAVDYFGKLFSDDQEIELHHLDCIDQRVHRDDNNMLEAIPNKAEIKEDVFGLNPNSTLGPDGFGGALYQSYWDIIKSDLIDVIQ
ncbi:hypothetical protein H5410_055923 [Solanum commersonii]|uniref:Endonuclease/exonuclease/phosphatase domain-containing protein n=1 Tax=Solanum commersonii TaxID=4109 RepID=A0A9J5WK73_SOLCO|nr:hypothetical protein H5410_055923 [Solanum commersonii]